MRRHAAAPTSGVKMRTREGEDERTRGREDERRTLPRPTNRQTTYTVEDEAAAHGFARAWSELGYNSLGEPGVVRCDLLQVGWALP